MATEHFDRDPVEELAEEFLARYRRGENPSPSEYAERYREWSDEIRELFPALVMMEQISPAGADDNAQADDLAGETPRKSLPKEFGDYRIVRTLGQGGMGIVYEAVHQSLDRHVALKVLPNTRLNSETLRERFRREAKAAAALHHTNIVPVFDVGECDGVMFYAMQFIPGKSLDEIIRRRRLGQALTPGNQSTSEAATNTLFDVADDQAVPEDNPSTRNQKKSETAERSIPALPRVFEGSDSNGANQAGVSAQLEDQSIQLYFRSVAEIGVQVARALAYVHQRDVLHRDIKPSNLLVDESGKIWITDFGLAKTSGPDDLTHTGGFVGTLRYMAPERLRGESNASSDIYGLGATLYELLALRPAFQDDDRVRLMERIANEEPLALRKIEPRIPIDLETIVHKSLGRQPSQRYASAAILADDLQRWLDCEPIQARPISWLGRLTRWSQRRPLVATLYCLILVISLAGFSLVTWKWREADRQRIRAETNLWTAQNVVTDFYTQLSRDWGPLDEKPGTQSLRHELLDKARQYFQDFVRQNRSSGNQFQLAFAHYSLGNISLEIGDIDQAIDYFDRALPVLQELAENSTDNAETLKVLGNTWSGIGYATTLMHQLERSQQARETSVVYFKQLADRDPESVEYANDLAGAYTNLAMTLGETGRHDAAAEYLLKAIDIRHRLNRESSYYGFLEGEASSLRHYGDLLRKTGGIREAIEAYERALSIYVKLENEHPNIDWALDQLGACCVVLGSAYRTVGQEDKAFETLQLGVETLKTLSGRNPDVPSYQDLLSRAYNNLGMVVLQLGRRNFAREQFVSALNIKQHLVNEFPDSPRYQENLAVTLHNLGTLDHDLGSITTSRDALRRALAMYRDLLERDRSTPDTRNHLASVLSDLAATCYTQRDFDQGIRLAEESVAVLEALCEESPALGDRKNDLAGSQIVLGTNLFGEAFLSGKEFEDHSARAARIRELFESAVNITERLVDQHPKQVDYVKNLSSAYYNAGSILLHTGHPEEALEKFQLSIGALSDLATNQQGGSFYSRILGKRYNDLAEYHWKMKELDLAKQAVGQAIEHRKAVLGDDPNERASRRELVQSLKDMAELEYESNKLSEAVDWYRQAAETIDENVAPRQRRLADLRLLAVCYVRLGQINTKLAKTTELLLYARKALSTRQQIVNLADSAPARWSLGESHITLAYAHQRANELATAREHYQSALNLHSSLVAQFPDRTGYRVSYAGSHVNLGLILRMQGELDEALRYLEIGDQMLTAILKEDPEQKMAARFQTYCRREKSATQSALAQAFVDSVNSVDPQPSDSVQAQIALQNATAACELSNWKNANRIATLAAVYAAMGQPAEAVKHQRRAIELLGPDDDRAQEMNDQLQRYIEESSQVDDDGSD